MAGVYEYVLTLQDKMSGTMQKITGVTTDTAARFASLQAKTDSLKQHTSDFGNTIGGLKQRLDLLRSERDLIDIGDIEKVKQYDQNIATLEKRIGTLEPASRKAQTGLAGVIETAWKFNQISELFGRAAESLRNMTAPGLEFEKKMADLSAITGIAGKDLEGLGRTARKVGIESGVGAGGAVEAYKLLASQIDVSKIGIKGLNILQNETIKLAQASGMEMGDAANSLAGTINQFGLQADQASRIINVLAAGSKYGAAEIPELAQSFKVVGASASAAGLDVESTAGAIETLSKMNLKGAEAGTALRNVLLKMQTELGVDLKVTKLSDALAGLKPKMGDAAFMAKTFGAENMAAAQFLSANADMVEEMTQRVTGTNVAYEQAAINTETVSHKMAKLTAWFDNVKISIFNATKPMLSYVAATAQTFSGVAQLVPILTGMGALHDWLKTKLWLTSYAQDGVTVASRKFVIWEKMKAGALKISTAAQWVYNGAGAIGGAVMTFLKSKVEGVRNAMLGGTLGTTLMSGAMALATVAAGAFAIGLRAVGHAFKAIPIIGWIAAAIGAIVALFALLWNRSEKFRGFWYGLWEGVKAIFHNIGVFMGIVYENLIKPIFSKFGEVVAWLKESVLLPLGGFFAGIWDGIVSGLNWFGSSFSGVFEWIGGVLGAIGLRFTSFWEFTKSLFMLGAKILFWPFTLLFKLFPNLGAWMEEKVWEPIKAVFEKIAQRLGKLIEPIKKIWGKLFKGEEYKDVGDAYVEGAEKGKRKNKDSTPDQTGGIGDLMAGIDSESNASKLNPYSFSFDTNKESKDTKGPDNKKDDSLSLGVPQSYKASSDYNAIASKFGINAGDNGMVANDQPNEGEKPVKSIANRVEEISGSLKKMAAAVALPIALAVGTANASQPENNLFGHMAQTTEVYDQTEINNNDGDVRSGVSTPAKTNNQGKTITIDRFTDKIEIHIHTSDTEAGKAVADNVRDEVEKALAEILNV